MDNGLLKQDLEHAESIGDWEMADAILGEMESLQNEVSQPQQQESETQGQPLQSTTAQGLQKIDRDFFANSTFQPSDRVSKKTTRGTRITPASKAEDTDEYIFRGLPQEAIDEIMAPVEVSANRGRGTKIVRGHGRREKADLERLRIVNPVLAEEIEKMGGLEAFTIGAGEGFSSLLRGVGIKDKKTDDEKLFDDQLREQKRAAEAGKLVGQTAPLLVPGAAIPRIAVGAGSRIALGSTLGAIEGGVVARGEDQSVVQGAGLGLLFGAGGEALAPLVSRFGRKLVIDKTGKSVDSVLNDDLTPTPELQKALDDSGQTFDEFVQEVSAEAGSPAANARRQTAFEDLDLTPTEAQRTRDANLFSDQQDAFRSSGKVKAALERQEEILTLKAKDQITATGGKPELASTSSIQAITDKATQLDGKISQLYKQAKEAAPGAKNIRFSKVAQSLRSNNPINTRSDGTVSALRDEMKRLGFLDEAGSPTRLTSVEAAENLRQFSNSLFNGANPLAKGVISDFKAALDDDVFRSAGGDLFKTARKEKHLFEKGLDAAKKNKFDTRKTSLVRDILNNTISEENFADKALRRTSKYRASDLKELKNYLTNGTEGQTAQGLKAWNDLRSEALNRIKEKAFKGPVTQTGTQSLSRAGLESALKEIGPQKFNVLFSPSEQQFLKRLSAISALKEPPPGTFTGSGPSSPAINKLTEVIRKIPVFGDFAATLPDFAMSKSQERRVLNLINDVQKIEKENAKKAAAAFRESRKGAVVATSPLLALPASAEDQQ